jgi:DNA-binding transcriptional LysR family regulator
MKINQMESLRIFKKVTELGSFNLAANQLNMSPARVSTAIKHLEQHLSTTLIKRSTRSLKITANGIHCLATANSIFEQWDILEEGLIDANKLPKGKLKISVPVSWGIKVFGKIVSSFSDIYPDINLNIQLDDTYSNLLKDDFDFVMRLTNKLEDSSLLCRKIKSYTRILCATPKYLEKVGTPKTPEMLMQHNCLLFDQYGKTKKWRFIIDDKALDVHVNAYQKSNNSALLYDLLLNGSGIALIPSFLVEDDIQLGRLTVLLENYKTEPLDLYLLRAKTLSLSEKHKVFIEHMSNVL